MKENQFNLRLIQFIQVYSLWEAEKIMKVESSEVLEDLKVKCDNLLESLSELSNRSIQEVNDFVQELYEKDIYYNNDIPTSYFLLVTKLMNSIEQTKDKKSYRMNIELDEVKIIQIVAIIKAHIMRRLENFKR